MCIRDRIFKVVSFFLLTAKGGRIGDLPTGIEIEVAEARWVPLEDAPTLLSYGGASASGTHRASAISISMPGGSTPILPPVARSRKKETTLKIRSPSHV